MDYYSKYLKYKNKYLELKQSLYGGDSLKIIYANVGIDFFGNTKNILKDLEENINKEYQKSHKNFEIINMLKYIKFKINYYTFTPKYHTSRCFFPLHLKQNKDTNIEKIVGDINHKLTTFINDDEEQSKLNDLFKKDRYNSSNPHYKELYDNLIKSYLISYTDVNNSTYEQLKKLLDYDKNFDILVFLEFCGNELYKLIEKINQINDTISDDGNKYNLFLIAQVRDYLTEFEPSDGIKYDLTQIDKIGYHPSPHGNNYTKYNGFLYKKSITLNKEKIEKIYKTGCYKYDESKFALRQDFDLLNENILIENIPPNTKLKHTDYDTSKQIVEKEIESKFNIDIIHKYVYSPFSQINSPGVSDCLFSFMGIGIFTVGDKDITIVSPHFQKTANNALQHLENLSFSKQDLSKKKDYDMYIGQLNKLFSIDDDNLIVVGDVNCRPHYFNNSNERSTFAEELLFKFRYSDKLRQFNQIFTHHNTLMYQCKNISRSNTQYLNLFNYSTHDVVKSTYTITKPIQPTVHTEPAVPLVPLVHIEPTIAPPPILYDIKKKKEEIMIFIKFLDDNMRLYNMYSLGKKLEDNLKKEVFQKIRDEFQIKIKSFEDLIQKHRLTEFEQFEEEINKFKISDQYSHFKKSIEEELIFIASKTPRAYIPPAKRK